MDISKLNFIKYGKHVIVHDDKMKKISIPINTLTSFGDEVFNDMIYTNWILNDSDKLIFENIENSIYIFFKEEFNIDSIWIWKSSIRHTDFGLFLRTTNKNNKKYNKNEIYDINIILNRIWINKDEKSFGIVWSC